MVSAHKKLAIKEIRSHYGSSWDVKIIPVGVELRCIVTPELVRHVFFNFVRDDFLGLRVQPGLGVTLSAVNTTRDRISSRHEYTVDAIAGFVFLNNLLDPANRKNGGWLFKTAESLQPAFGDFLELVDKTIFSIGFFESLNTIDDYIVAVESQRWAFFGVMPTYLYALIAKGEIGKAKKLAAEHRALAIQIGIERGFVQRESDAQPYNEILAIPD